MPDLFVVEKILSNLLANFENLSKHRNVSSMELKSNIDTLWIVERGLFLCIQNILDLFAHIISYDFDEKWEYYSDIPEVLLKHNLLTPDERDLLNKMISIRNRLSHEYLTLDANVLSDIMNNRLDDFNKFIEIIKNYCKKDNP
ncbi:MAG: DUF86 domain-containing protein [Ignavibacterium sp.]|nr:DUF86 domain-containing protein [Ignavibacterium sp.]MDW8376263.1 DUF86 domain-containing protein [Ignavibacteriales bacterium]